MEALDVLLDILADSVLVTREYFMDLVDWAGFLMGCWFFVLVFVALINFCKVKVFATRFESAFENGSLRNFPDGLHSSPWGGDFCIVHFIFFKKCLRACTRHLVDMFVYPFSELGNKILKYFLVSVETLERNFSAALNLINRNLKSYGRNIRLSWWVLTHCILLLYHGMFVNW